MKDKKTKYDSSSSRLSLFIIKFYKLKVKIPTKLIIC